MPKPTFKDAQMTIRLSSEVLEALKQDAKAENLSMADFVVKLYQAYKQENDTKSRLDALERAVFQRQSGA